MEKIKILYTKAVNEYLENLVHVLFINEYFSYPENADKYVEDIKINFENNVAIKPHKSSPKELLSLGNYYISYVASRRTAWYTFFDKKDNRILVKFITNNHIAKARFINKLK